MPKNNELRLAVSTYSLRRWRRANHKTLEQSLDWIASTGVKAVELVSILDETAPDPRKQIVSLRRRCDKLGLEAAGYCCGAELLAEAPAQREVIDQVKQHVRLAAAFGARTLRHDITRGPQRGERTEGMSLGAILKNVVPAIREIADFGQELGVKTSFENHGFYLQTADRVEKLLRAVAHRNFGLTLDMGNFLCLDQDPVEAVARLARYAVMVHAKDFHVVPKTRMPPSGFFATPTKIALRGAIAGHGVIDLPAQLRLLKKAGYRGYLSLEFEGMEEPTQGVTLGLEYLRRALVINEQ